MKKRKFRALFRLHISLIGVLALTTCLLCTSYAFASDVKVLGKVSTASISDVTEEEFVVTLPNNASVKVPSSVEYIVQERTDYTKSPRIHMFGMNDNGANFEIILESFDLDTMDLTLLDVMAQNSMVFGANSEVLNSKELNVNGLNGFEYTLSNMKFNNQDIKGNVQAVLLTDSSVGLCVVLVGHQNENDFYSEILTKIISTIKIG